MERVFFPVNKELEDQLHKIKLAIQGEQNGVASRSMGSLGYKKNYGVPYTSLRRIAGEHQPSKKLANCLWGIDYRETKLLALLLFPKDEMTLDDVVRLLPDVKEMGLAEFACRDLFSQLPFAERLAGLCLENEAPLASELAYLLAGRLLEKKTEAPDEMSISQERVEADLAKGRSSLAKAVSIYLKQLGLFAKYNAKVMAFADSLSESESMQLRWVAEEIRTFVEYTEHKKA